MTKPVIHVETLGERLRRQAQRIAERHQVPMPWRRIVTATQQRDAARRQPARAHWGRVEASTLRDATVLSAPSDASGVVMPPSMMDRLPSTRNRHVNGMRLHEGPIADALARERRA